MRLSVINSQSCRSSLLLHSSNTYLFVATWKRPKQSPLKLVSGIFIKFLFFHQMIALLNLWKMFFIESKMFFSFSKYSIFCLFSIPFHTFQTQKDIWKWNNLMSWIGLHKFADIIFGITQKPLYIISPHLVRWYITNKGIFLNLFCNLNSNWSLLPDQVR